MPRPFQFSLRTMLVAVAAVAAISPIFPLIRWQWIASLLTLPVGAWLFAASHCNRRGPIVGGLMFVVGAIIVSAAVVALLAVPPMR